MMVKHLLIRGVLVASFALSVTHLSFAQIVPDSEASCSKGFVFVPFMRQPDDPDITPKCYRFFSQKATFEDAMERCDRYKSTLATPKHRVDAESLANYVLENQPQSKRYWIGLTDQEEEGVFKWQDDGTKLKANFSRWTVTEPDSAEDVGVGAPGDQQDCVKMAIWIFGRKSSAQFYDSHCNKMEYFVCEKEPIIPAQPVYVGSKNNSDSSNGTVPDSQQMEVDFISPKSQVQLSKNMSMEPENNESHPKPAVDSQHFPLEVVAEYEILEEQYEPGGHTVNSSVKVTPEVSDTPTDSRTPIEPPGEMSRSQSRNNGTKVKLQRERRTCSLKCHLSYLRAACPLKYFPQLKDTKVVLNNASCRPRKNRTHLIVHTKLDNCGTIIENVPKKNQVSFRNTVHITTSGAGIVRNSKLAASLTELMVLDCRYPQRHSVTQRFNPAGGRPPVYRTEGEGEEFDHTISLYKTKKYDCPYSREEYPVEIPLSQRIFLEVTLNMPSKRVELHPVTCFATPDSNPYNSNNYIMMQDGCIEDETFQIEGSDSRKISRLSVGAFRFVGYFRQVYIHCKLIVCRINSEDSAECPFACNPEAKNRRKRESEDDSLREKREITSHSGMIEIVHDSQEEGGNSDVNDTADNVGKTDKATATTSVKSEQEEKKKKARQRLLPQESANEDGGNSGERQSAKHIIAVLSSTLATFLLRN